MQQRGSRGDCQREATVRFGTYLRNDSGFFGE